MTTPTRLSFFDEASAVEEQIPLPTGTTCAGCGDAITWRRTKSGKPVPLDPGLHWSSPNGRGKRLMLFAEDGTLVNGFECKPKDPGAQCGRVSHTCPKAESFRK